MVRVLLEIVDSVGFEELRLVVSELKAVKVDSVAKVELLEFLSKELKFEGLIVLEGVLVSVELSVGSKPELIDSEERNLVDAEIELVVSVLELDSELGSVAVLERRCVLVLLLLVLSDSEYSEELGILNVDTVSEMELADSEGKPFVSVTELNSEPVSVVALERRCVLVLL